MVSNWCQEWDGAPRERWKMKTQSPWLAGTPAGRWRRLNLSWPLMCLNSRLLPAHFWFRRTNLLLRPFLSMPWAVIDDIHRTSVPFHTTMGPFCDVKNSLLSFCVQGVRDNVGYSLLVNRKIQGKQKISIIPSWFFFSYNCLPRIFFTLPEN